MGVQQTSLDFFNLPPEKGKSGEKVDAGEVQEVEKVEKVQEVQKVLEVQEVPEVQEVQSVGEIEEIQGMSKEDHSEIKQYEQADRLIEDDENMYAEEQEKELRAEEVSGIQMEAAIVVDENVRVLDFVVKEPTPGSLKTVKKSTRGRMKLSEMDTLVDLVVVPEDIVLFQKRYYNIGAVSEMFKVNISLIRFWENEFDILKPKKNGKGDRLFRPEDIKNLQLIYHLLREKKYTIEGAKDFLKKNKKADENFAVIDSLKKMRSFLLELKSNL